MIGTSIRLSLAAPAFNEADGIEAVIRDWHAFLSGRAGIAEFEIVVCNDGSRDSTGAILDRLTLGMPQLRVLHFPQNQGAAAALNVGSGSPRKAASPSSAATSRRTAR